MKKIVKNTVKKYALFSVLALSAFFAFAQSDVPTVDGTIAALQGGLTAVPLDAAVANIEGWEAQLSGSPDSTLQTIAIQLGELKEALQADTINGTAVGQLLRSLGEGTVEAASGNAQLTDLGNLLVEAGTGLMGGGASGGVMSGGMVSGGGM